LTSITQKQISKSVKKYSQFLEEKVSSGLMDQLRAKNPDHPFLKAFKDDEDFETVKDLWNSGEREEAAREFRMRLVKKANSKLGTSLLLMVAGASLVASGYNALEPKPDPVIPPPRPPKPPDPTSEEYIIKKGDSIWKIAKSHLPKGASNADIMAYTKQIAGENGMNVKLIDGVLSKVPKDPDLIFPGGKLLLNKFAGA
jgi:hypothetical protein